MIFKVRRKITGLKGVHTGEAEWRQNIWLGNSCPQGGALSTLLWNINLDSLPISWCKEQVLSINPNKTEMALFTKKRKKKGLKHPVFLTLNLALPKRLNTSGFHCRLTWISHINNRVKKVYLSFEQYVTPQESFTQGHHVDLQFTRPQLLKNQIKSNEQYVSS